METRNTTSRIPFAASSHFWAVLLAGGDGVRLRGLTRRIAGDSRPKQFCRLVGNTSLFEQTRSRLKPLYSPDRQVFVLSRAHERYYSEDLRESAAASLVQPLNRGTGIGIILALIHILERDPHAVVGLFPCDHYYSNEDSFRLTIRAAAACAEHRPSSIILVGAEAEYAEVEYGWIEPDAVVLQTGVGPLFQVHRFWEKPPLDHARGLMRRGCLWNTFVAFGLAATLLDILCARVPEAVISVAKAMADLAWETAYPLLETVDFSRDVLAHETRRLLVLRDRKSGWADLGSPDRVFETLARHAIRPEWFSEADKGLFEQLALHRV